MKPGEKKFARNMAIGGATGAVAGSAGTALATSGRHRFRPIKHGVAGGALTGAAGLAMIADRKHKSKVKKSAFGVEHAV